MSEVRLVEPGEPIPWDDLRDGPWARTFLEPMLRDGVTPYVGNVHTELRVLIAEGHVLPLTVNPGGETNAWVVSPRNAYIDYAAEERRLR